MSKNKWQIPPEGGHMDDADGIFGAGSVLDSETGRAAILAGANFRFAYTQPRID